MFKQCDCDQIDWQVRPSVVRGGSWNNNARNCRSAYRNRNEPANRNDNLGFRCAPAHDLILSDPEQIDHLMPTCIKLHDCQCIRSSKSEYSLTVLCPDNPVKLMNGWSNAND